MKAESLNTNQNQPSLDERFAGRPRLRERLHGIADMIDQALAELCTAHVAEARAIEQIRQLGRDLLADWGEQSEEDARLQAQKLNPELILYGKKELLTWRSTYGEVSIWEQRLRHGRRGAEARPFCAQAGLTHRGYSLPLQKVIADFGADESFLMATKKVREHYGIDLPLSGARQHTLKHAKAIGVVQHQPAQPAATLVTFMDGSMVPIVEPGPGPDKRKGKSLFWKQALLCAARSKDAVECVYGATLGTVNMAGLVWRATAVSAGWVETTFVHGIGDGAPSIMKAFEEQFGTDPAKARFTVDFWHVTEYLGQAAPVIAPDQPKAWLHEQKGHLLENHVESVLQALELKFEPEAQEPAPVRTAHHYIKERKDNMDYAGARAQGLPIGSGEVESAHGHVIQDRLKKSGAWWLFLNVQHMLQLRTTRANGDWDRYWKEFAKN